jgi:hypothetical protein
MSKILRFLAAISWKFQPAQAKLDGLSACETHRLAERRYWERLHQRAGEGTKITRRDLEEIIGTRTRIAEVLNRKRGLSVGMIRRLHERLGISAEVLIRPSRKNAA